MTAMKRLTLIIFAILCCLQPLSAQDKVRGITSRRHSSAAAAPRAVENTVTTGSRSSVSPINVTPPKAEPDTVYAFQTTKRNGWFAPLGLLTKEQATHRSQSFMFTGRNNKGHWTKMESINGYGNHVPSGISPYIMKLNSDLDSHQNEEWKEKLAGSCIFEFIPDATGENIVQERAFNKDGELLYSYSPISIGDRRIIGSYRDINGYPAEMRKDADHAFGTLVLITQDEYGHDHIIQNIDSKRQPKPNSDGAYAEIYDYDKAGHVIMQRSIDEFGNNMIDNYGNCAVLAEYDNRHNVIRQTFLDEKLQPMKMPNTSGSSNSGVIVHNREYDQNCNLTTVYYTLPDGTPAANDYGSHRCDSKYDDRGNQIELISYDIEGNPIPYDNVGAAKVNYTYNDKGLLTEQINLDRNLQPLESESYFYKIVYDYDAYGNTVSDKRYIIRDGQLSLYYSEVTEKSPELETTTWSYDDGSKNIRIRDNKGRKTEYSCYGPDGKLIQYEGNGYASQRTEIKDFPGHTITIDRYFNQNNEPVVYGDYDHKICEYDSINHRNLVRDMIGDQLQQMFLLELDNKMDYVIGQYDCNIFGVPTRAGNTAARYYYTESPRNASWDWIAFAGRDEFNEPDYIVNRDDNVIFCIQKNSNNKTTYFDENNNEIVENEGYQKLRNELPKLMTIEVTDSAAYAHGLRDNDVILQYGRYKADLLTPPTEAAFKAQWAVRSVLDADEPKDMVVFRIEDAKAGKYGPVTIPALTGTPSELGFVPHIRYLTKKQNDRILASMRESGIDPMVADTTARNNLIVISFNEMFRSQRNFAYQSEVKDHAILLGADDKETGRAYTVSNFSDIDLISGLVDTSKANAVTAFPAPTYYFTPDGRKVIPLGFSGMLYDYNVDDADFSKLRTMFSRQEKEIKGKMKKRKPFDSKKLEGYWVVEQKDSNFFNPQGYMYFDKNGRCFGEYSHTAMVQKGKTTEGWGSPLYRVTQNIDGKWDTGEHLLNISHDKQFDRYECVFVGDAEEGHDINELVAYYQKDFYEYPNWYKGRLEKWNNIIDDAMIESVSDTELILRDRLGYGTRFVRRSGKPEKSDDIFNKAMLQGTWAVNKDGMDFILYFENGRLTISVTAGLPISMSQDNTGLAVRGLASGNWTLDGDSLNIDLDDDSVSTGIDAIGDMSAEDLETLRKDWREEFKALLKDTDSDNGFLSKIISLTPEELKLLDVTLTKCDRKVETVMGTVEDPSGYLATNGYQGSYVILKWCDWNCEMTIEEFQDEFAKQKENPKKLLLLPLGRDEKGNDTFGVPFELDVPGVQLGIRLKDVSISYPYYVRQILPRYKMCQ